MNTIVIQKLHVYPPSEASMKKDVQPSFEDRMQRLQAIVADLERGDVPLETSVTLYKEGIELSRACHTQLEKARHDIQLYTDGAMQPFESTEQEGIV